MLRFFFWILFLQFSPGFLLFIRNNWKVLFEIVMYEACFLNLLNRKQYPFITSLKQEKKKGFGKKRKKWKKSNLTGFIDGKSFYICNTMIQNCKTLVFDILISTSKGFLGFFSFYIVFIRIIEYMICKQWNSLKYIVYQHL